MLEKKIELILSGYDGEVSEPGLLEDFRAGRWEWDNDVKNKLLSVLQLLKEEGEMDESVGLLLSELSSVACSAMYYCTEEQQAEIAQMIEESFDPIKPRTFEIRKKDSKD